MPDGVPDRGGLRCQPRRQRSANWGGDEGPPRAIPPDQRRPHAVGPAVAAVPEGQAAGKDFEDCGVVAVVVEAQMSLGPGDGVVERGIRPDADRVGFHQDIGVVSRRQEQVVPHDEVGAVVPAATEPLGQLPDHAVVGRIRSAR